MDHKICIRCHLEKTLPEFPKDVRYKDKLNSYCKACKLQQNTAYRRNLKKLIISGYGGKCTCCSESNFEFLSIEHKDGNGRKHRKSIGSHTTFYKWVIANNFPDTLSILCYNCNCSRGFFGYCPHKVGSKYENSKVIKNQGI